MPGFSVCGAVKFYAKILFFTARKEKNSMKKYHKGFTLIELLIVIVVIGILSAMMMLASNEVVNSAKTTKIINDFTQLKKAAAAWYLENYSRIGTGTEGVALEKGINYGGKNMRFSDFIKNSGGSEFLKYISNGTSMKLGGKHNDNTSDYYIIRSVEKSHVWYVSYYLKDKPQLKAKLASKAAGLGLVGCASLTDDKTITAVYTNQDYINLMLLNLN